MTQKHTPAPWTKYKCQCSHPACKQYTISTQGTVGFDEADANLIIAAPELLEALKEMYEMENDSIEPSDFDYEISQGNQIAAVYKKALIAIQKAEGK